MSGDDRDEADRRLTFGALHDPFSRGGGVGGPVPTTVRRIAGGGESKAAPTMHLPQIAKDLQTTLRQHRADYLINDENERDIQALCVAEEAGELVGAYRRYAGKARRSAGLDEVAAEVADVLIVTAIFAYLLGIDLDAAVAAKLDKIYSRGWKEPAP